jgi:hypothetical protein
VYRDPAQVWPRFKWRGKRGLAINFGRACTFQTLWIQHNRRIMEALQTSSCDRIVLSYHHLMAGDEEFRRLQAFVGRDLVDHRQPGLYRSRSRPDLFLRLADRWLSFRAGLRAGDTLAALQELRALETATAVDSTR